MRVAGSLGEKQRVMAKSSNGKLSGFFKSFKTREAAGEKATLDLLVSAYKMSNDGVRRRWWNKLTH